MLSAITTWLLASFSSLGYVDILILMAIESSFLPLPSEVVLPPAGWLAAAGKLNLSLIILTGTLGSVLGALFNYFLAITLGRKIIYGLTRSRWAKLFLLSENKLQKSENYFLRYGQISTFLGRLIPGIRHLISLPAGLAKMDLKSFIVFTALGAGLWSTVLVVLGYLAGANQDQLRTYTKELSWLMLILVALAVLAWFIYKKLRSKKRL